MGDTMVVAYRHELDTTRRGKGLGTLRALAERAGVHHETVRNVVRGQRTTLRTATALADALGTPVGDLFRHANGDRLGGAA